GGGGGCGGRGGGGGGGGEAGARRGRRFRHREGIGGGNRSSRTVPAVAKRDRQGNVLSRQGPARIDSRRARLSSRRPGRRHDRLPQATEGPRRFRTGRGSRASTRPSAPVSDRRRR